MSIIEKNCFLCRHIRLFDPSNRAESVEPNNSRQKRIRQIVRRHEKKCIIPFIFLLVLCMLFPFTAKTVMAEETDIQIINETELDELLRAGNTCNTYIIRNGSTTSCTLYMASSGSLYVSGFRYQQIVVSNTNNTTTYGTFGTGSPYTLNCSPAATNASVIVGTLTIPVSFSTVRVKYNYNGFGVLYTIYDDFIYYNFNSTVTVN